MTTTGLRPSVGTSVRRIDGEAKVLGHAKYAFEQVVNDPAYLHPVQASIARGRVTGIDTSAAEALDGVHLVMTQRNAPELADTSDRELAVLQSDEVAFRGQLIGAVAAGTSEIARHAADLVRIGYAVHEHDTELREDHPGLYEPERVNPSYPTDTSEGDVEEALRRAVVQVDQRYTTPMEHNNPMEPHSCIATWEDGPSVRLFDSTQGAHGVAATLARVFGLDKDDVRVTSPYVGGGFGSKGLPHAHNVLAVLAA
jgi:xanthine dehydrogenase YagR molybdenum-binding subunit